jgi:hypothetical protein
MPINEAFTDKEEGKAVKDRKVNLTGLTVAGIVALLQQELVLKEDQNELLRVLGAEDNLQAAKQLLEGGVNTSEKVAFALSLITNGFVKSSEELFKEIWNVAKGKDKTFEQVLYERKTDIIESAVFGPRTDKQRQDLTGALAKVQEDAQAIRNSNDFQLMRKRANASDELERVLVIRNILENSTAYELDNTLYTDAKGVPLLKALKAHFEEEYASLAIGAMGENGKLFEEMAKILRAEPLEMISKKSSWWQKVTGILKKSSIAGILLLGMVHARPVRAAVPFLLSQANIVQTAQNGQWKTTTYGREQAIVPERTVVPFNNRPDDRDQGPGRRPMYPFTGPVAPFMPTVPQLPEPDPTPPGGSGGKAAPVAIVAPAPPDAPVLVKPFFGTEGLNSQGSNFFGGRLTGPSIKELQSSQGDGGRIFSAPTFPRLAGRRNEGQRETSKEVVGSNEVVASVVSDVAGAANGNNSGLALAVPTGKKEASSIEAGSEVVRDQAVVLGR